MKTGGWTVMFVRETSELQSDLCDVTPLQGRPEGAEQPMERSSPGLGHSGKGQAQWCLRHSKPFFQQKRRRDAHIKAALRISPAHLVNVDGLKRHVSPHRVAAPCLSTRVF